MPPVRKVYMFFLDRVASLLPDEGKRECGDPSRIVRRRFDLAEGKNGLL